jgi:hypothetical protein
MPGFIEDEYDLSIIAQFPKTEYGRAYLGWLRKEYEREDRNFKENPRVCDEDFRRDFRFKLGLIEGLKRALDKPEKALHEIEIKGGV